MQNYSRKRRDTNLRAWKIYILVQKFGRLVELRNYKSPTKSWSDDENPSDTRWRQQLWRSLTKCNDWSISGENVTN